MPVRLDEVRQVMRAGAGLHRDETAGQRAHEYGELAPAHAPLERDPAALVEADNVEAVLAEIDTERVHGHGVVPP
jgi:hypothetical protein